MNPEENDKNHSEFWPKIKVPVYILLGVGAYLLFMLLLGFPVPRGYKVNSNYYTYYKNIRGIYYISVEETFTLLNTGHWGYLKDVDESTFVILDKQWAKDSKHIWYGDKLISNVDVETFHITDSGLLMDKNNGYTIEHCSGDEVILRPLENGIDVPTTEYFVYQNKTKDLRWMRDKDYVYFNGKRIDVDRNSFNAFGNQWFIDNKYVYTIKRNYKTNEQSLIRIDSLQAPIEAGYLYLRNGNNIIYLDSVILRNIEVTEFKQISAGKYLVNDMLFLNGKPFLKDTLDVKNTKFYFYGHIANDGKNVFYGRNLLDDIDAATFRQTGKEKFEDKNYIYTVKDRIYGEDYPFNKKKK